MCTDPDLRTYVQNVFLSCDILNSVKNEMKNHIRENFKYQTHRNAKIDTPNA